MAENRDGGCGCILLAIVAVLVICWVHSIAETQKKVERLEQQIEKSKE